MKHLVLLLAYSFMPFFVSAQSETEQESYIFGQPIDVLLINPGLLFSSPSTKDPIFIGIPKGASVRLLGKAPDFYRVAYKTLTGYVSFTDIDSTYNMFLARHYPRVAIENNKIGSPGRVDIAAPLRKQPTTKSEMIREIPKGTPLFLIKYSDTYWKAEFEDDSGYVNKIYVHADLTGELLDKHYKAKYPSLIPVEIYYNKQEAIRLKREEKQLERESYRTLMRGPRGGCYYINSSGNKVYVDRSLCN